MMNINKYIELKITKRWLYMEIYNKNVREMILIAEEIHRKHIWTQMF